MVEVRDNWTKLGAVKLLKCNCRYLKKVYVCSLVTCVSESRRRTKFIGRWMQMDGDKWEVKYF